MCKIYELLLKKASQCQFILIGCYADWISGFRDLSGLGLAISNTVGGGSVMSCISYCSSLSFSYAGVENG